MHDPAKVIAARLRNLRKALGIRTQTEFAQLLGIEKNTYNPFEKGTRSLTFETACLIRVKIKIPVDWLFWGDDDEVPYHIIRKLDALAQSRQDTLVVEAASPRKARRRPAA